MEMVLRSNEEVHENKLPKLHVETSILEEQQEKEQGFHVLAVDDSLIDRTLLEKLLKISSYKVTCVESGDKALEYLGLVNEMESNSTSISMSAAKSTQQEGMKVNLIMTDFCMPGMSGYDLLKRVKGSSWKDVPVVIMSSENIPSRINMCLEGGAEKFLLKPLQLSDVEKLQSHLKKSNLHNLKTKDHDDGDDNYNDNDANDEELKVNENNSNSSSCNNNNNLNNGNSSSSISKRKALNSSESTDRRPKIKGLAVV